MTKTRQAIIKSIIIFIFSIIFILIQAPFKIINKLPMIGSITNITSTEFFFQSGNNEIDASIPNVKYQGEIDSILNEDINNFTYKIIENFFEEYNDKNHHYTKIDYEVITDNYLWFTLKINILETMADSYNHFKYYHINKKTNKIVSLNDLFKNDNYKRNITKEIKREMQNRMEKDETLIYWINDENSDYEVNLISNNQNFYFNKKGELVIVFNENEISPSYMGSQEFIINSSVYEDYLN